MVKRYVLGNRLYSNNFPNIRKMSHTWETSGAHICTKTEIISSNIEDYSVISQMFANLLDFEGDSVTLHLFNRWKTGRLSRPLKNINLKVTKKSFSSCCCMTPGIILLGFVAEIMLQQLALVLSIYFFKGIQMETWIHLKLNSIS